MQNAMNAIGYHEREIASSPGVASSKGHTEALFTYTFENFFHPFVGELISKLNRGSLADIMDAKWQQDLTRPFFDARYHPTTDDEFMQVESHPEEIDVSNGGPYAVYNWELFYHIPLTIAVHLSKNQRFAEAQRWFHYIFDPACNDQSEEPPKRFWKFLRFRQESNPMRIDDVVRILSIPREKLSHDEQHKQDDIIKGYGAILKRPFMPHAVARTRPVAYQYCVVMKYLDNLIAWGDYLFQQDTVESINEATQRYVLAANILGPRPQRIPPRGKIRPKTFAQLKEGFGPIGNAMTELEGQLPFNLIATTSAPSSDQTAANASTLFGIGHTLYFCVPRNDKLLGYWDTVADRLFKIRHCMNIQGVVRPLALFDPPIDPGMLVKAAAAGIDVGSIVNGLNQPIGPIRSLALIQQALQLCGEVRGLGGALLSALEKGDAEQLALVRQGHEKQIHQMAQEVRFLQWKATQEATTSLLTNRATALERLHYYQRLLGLPTDPNASDVLTIDHSEKPDDPPKLTEENFDEAYSQLVGQYSKLVAFQKFPPLAIVDSASPDQQSGASGQGRLYLNDNENKELNELANDAETARISSTIAEGAAAIMGFLPGFNVNLHFWGVGGSSKIASGEFFANVGRAISSGFQVWAQIEEARGRNASKTAGYQRRSDEWMLQYNLAAHELMQIGRQILTSLIAEQIAHHEYLTTKKQIANTQEVDKTLREKFTNEDLYDWMQGEISRLYYEYYRFAFDIARRAERTMKQELMRPELDAQEFVKFNYFDGGRKGLLSGEALYLDVKRMEMAYHDNNKRELELTRHVSLRQLNPIALLSLKTTGSCVVTVPEWLYDLDCPGHYMRRIKSVALSIPSVVGPYTSVNCTLSLLRSSLRKSPIPKDGAYARQGTEDDRFMDYTGAMQSVVTSGAQNDSGLFETNLRDERFLPFEGAGAESTWKLDLPNPKDYPAFDYSTIADVILHIRYTARQGVEPNSVTKSLDELFAAPSNLALIFSLRHDFPTEWATFVNGTASFTATIRKDYFPYFVQGMDIEIVGFDLYDGQDVKTHQAVGDPVGATDGLEKNQKFTVVPIPLGASAPTPILTRNATTDFFLIIRYGVSR